MVEADRVVDFSILHGEIHIYHVYLYRYTFQDNNQRAERALQRGNGFDRSIKYPLSIE